MDPDLKFYLTAGFAGVMALLLIYLRRRPRPKPKADDDLGQNLSGECPKCKGKKEFPQPDGRKLVCNFCHGFGVVKAYAMVVYEHREHCKRCEGTGYIVVIPDRYPDGLPMPGTKVTVTRCPVPECKGGWLIEPKKLGYRHIRPLSKPPAAPPPPPAAPAPPGKKK